MSKNLIVHITCGCEEELKRALHENALFVQYYDGFESTMSREGVKQSTRNYYYDVEHNDLVQMVTHLQSVGTGFEYKIKILPKGCGNFEFQENAN